MPAAGNAPLRMLLADAARLEAERNRLLAELTGLQQRLTAQDRRVTELTAVAEQFVDNVSHEFRTPLTVIREYASILRDGLAGVVADPQRRYLELIIDRGDDLALLVEDLLDVGKFGTGLLTTRRKQHRVADIVALLRPTLERKAELKGITLDTDLGDGLPTVYCDAEHVERILANLVSNALKFSERGSRVQLWGRIANSTEVVLGVSDNGPGIGAEDAAAIFEPFTQLDGPARSSTKGFGLGLTVARQLAGVNLGQIMLVSQPGDGSTFSFTLPRATPAAILTGYLAMLNRLASRANEVSLVEAIVAPDTEPRWAVAADEFLHQAIRWQDLILPAALSHWRLLIAGGRGEATEAIARIEAGWSQFRRVPATSAAPQIQLFEAGVWPLESALAELIPMFADETEKEQSPATNSASPLPAKALSSALHDQQRAMDSDAWSLLAAWPYQSLMPPRR